MTNNNPFSLAIKDETRPSSSHGVLANTDQQRAVAEVQAGMMLAKMSPRDQIFSMDRILNACARPTLAESAVYTYGRGGTDITGPSIRLAEAMAQAWGNLSFGIRELEQTGGESTVQAFCWDMETNVRREMTFQVSHIRHTKKGSYRIEDPRDIYEHVANQGARRLRACILAVIPGDVTEAAVNQCEQTMKAQADTSPEAIQKMLAAFEPFRVTKEMIEKRIQRRIEAIQPAQVVALRKIHNSLKDGMSNSSDWFEQTEQEQPDPKPQPPKSKTESLKSDLEKKRQKETQDDQQTTPTVSQTAEPAPPAEKQKADKTEEKPLQEIPPKIQAELIEIDGKATAEDLDTWAYKHHRRLEKQYGEVWGKWIIGHVDRRRAFLNAEVPPGEEPPVVIVEPEGIVMVECPEAGGRMVARSDCELSECSKMCPAFNLGQGGSKLSIEV
jgi:hypothetical protein